MRWSSYHAVVLPRWLVVVLALIGLFGCGESLPFASRQARWGSSGPFETITTTQTVEPPGRAGANELWVRVDVPPMPGVRDPALALPSDFRRLRDFRYGLAEILEGDTKIEVRATGAVIPLSRAGRPVSLHYRSDPREPLRAPRVVYGSQAELTSWLLSRDVGRFAASLLFLLAACLLLVVSAHRRRSREITALALYLVTTGIPQMAECGELRYLIVPSSTFWMYAFATSTFLFPSAFARFVEITYVKGKRDRILTPLRLLGPVLMVVAVLLHLFSIVDLGVARLVADGLIVAVALRTAILLMPRLRAGTPAERVFFAGFAVGSIFLGHDIAVAFGLLPYREPVAYIGGVILLFGMALSLESRFHAQREVIANAKGRLEEKVRELQEKRAEVEALNVDLREQVMARSREIASLVASPKDVPRHEIGVVDHRYRIVRRIGEGGMGTVFAVERMRDKKPFALKIMHAGTRWSDAIRFMREAELAASVHHPNLISVVDVGMDRGTMYIVMELVKGHTLEDERAHFGDRVWARPILHEVAQGLAVLHDKRIIHRDLKPSNVMLPDPAAGAAVPKITDFGLACVEEPIDVQGATVEVPAEAGEKPISQGRVTQGGSVVGTPEYLAPESVHGSRDLSLASDVFSFGVMAYEMLTGRYPFHIPAFLQTSVEPPMPSGLDPRTADILMRCLASSPRARPSAAEVAAAFEA